MTPPDTTTSAIRVRPAYPRDIGAVVEFNRALARETEAKDLDGATLAAGVRAVFDDPARGSYFVAERDGEPIGSLLVTHEWSDWRNGEFWWIQSVYVAPDARGAGVFRRLYDFVHRRARETPGVSGLRLYVERDNRSAQAVYAAVGMAESHYRFYEIDFVLGSARERR